MTMTTTTTGAHSAPARQLPTINIGTFSIPLGLAALGGAWNAAAELLDAIAWPAAALFAAATILWSVFTVVYVVGTFAAPTKSFSADLRHPLLGPLTAYIPVIGILLISYYADELGDAAKWLVYLAVAALAVNAAQAAAHWIKSPLQRDDVHPGYTLPVVTGPFIASIGLVAVGAPQAATAAFGAGVYFWVVLGAIITARLITGSAVPQPLLPVLSILLSPPLAASIAWFARTRGQIDDLQYAIGGVTIILLLSQLPFLKDYLSLRFTSQHWIFTFPLAATGNAGVRWAAGAEFYGWQVAAWLVLSIATAAILAILAGTLRDVARTFGGAALRESN